MGKDGLYLLIFTLFLVLIVISCNFSVSQQDMLYHPQLYFSEFRGHLSSIIILWQVPTAESVSSYRCQDPTVGQEPWLHHWHLGFAIEQKHLSWGQLMT